jgi:hypothetical protein
MIGCCLVEFEVKQSQEIYLNMFVHDLPKKKEQNRCKNRSNQFSWLILILLQEKIPTFLNRFYACKKW